MHVTKIGSGPAMVFIHGAFADSRVWEPQQALASSSTLHLLTLSGYHPDRSVPDTVSAATQVSEVIAYLAQLGEAAALVGHSRGGRLAMKIAAQVPELVERLVLIEPGGVAQAGFYAGVERLPVPAGDPRAEVASLVEQGLTSSALQLYVDHGHGAGTWAGLGHRFREVACDNAHTIAMMIRDSSVPLSRDTLAKLSCSTLLLLGTQSPPVFAETAAVLRLGIARLDMSYVESDHFMTYKAAAACNTIINQWLSAGDHHLR